MSVESLPQGLVVGLVLPQGPPGVEVPEVPDISFEKLSRLFNELSLTFGYRNFQSSPDGMGASIYGDNIVDGLMVQPGLVQLTDPTREGAQRAADRADQVIKVAASTLGIVHILQLGVKWVFHVPCPSGARSFAMEKLARTTEEQLSDLSMGHSVWPGTHYLIASDEEGLLYSVRVEPLLRDDSFLFVEVDTSFSNISLDDVGGTIDSVLTYAQGPVMAHIEGLRG